MVMNVVIPMAGLGTRFPKEKYKMPKPLIDVCGKPMIQACVESLNIQAKYHFLIRNDENYEMICGLLKFICPNSDIISVNHTTQGPACSALLFKDSINTDQELIIANCDQIMWWNADVFLMHARYPEYDGVLVTYHSTTPKNSYCRIDEKGFVTQVKEKEVISNISLNGIHYWRKGRYFVESAEMMIANHDAAPNGEFYVAPSYNYMIQQMKKKVGIYHLANWQHNPIGVPEDLEHYIDKVMYAKK